MVTLVPIFFSIACVYSIVGLGGGSSYLAVLAWVGLPRDTLVPLALLCNLVVSGQATVAYARAGHFMGNLFWPLALGGIPFAFLGGFTSIQDKTFYFLLSVCLFLAAIRMFFPKALTGLGAIKPKVFWFTAPIVGALLGYLAGLIGLGGGIFLGPLLILSGVADAKQTAATTAPFVFVNSMAGLIAHHNHITSSLLLESLPLIFGVAAGGWLGSRLGVTRLEPLAVQRTTAVLQGLVSVRLFWRIFP